VSGARLARRSPSAPAPAAPAPASRGALRAVLVLALAGLGVAAYLTWLHAQAHGGVSSFCDISETFSCGKVATSDYSVLFGLPVALWGALGYGTMAALAAWGLAGRRPHPGWPAGLLALGAGGAVLAAVALAIVSEFVIGAWCLMCMAAWTISVALLAAASRAVRPAGVRAAVAADLDALAEHAGATGAVVVLAVVAVAASATLYPRYWENPSRGGLPGAQPAAPVERAAVTEAPPGTVVSYSDFLCPFCAKAHDELNQLLALRPDLKLVRRQFPLEMDCNPLLKRTIHPGACLLARAGICAEEQGRVREMDDALFANQEAKRPLDAVAAGAGLDVARLHACLESPETSRRLAADVAAGMRDGIRATPTFVVGRSMFVGSVPLAALPPPAGAAPPAR